MVMPFFSDAFCLSGADPVCSLVTGTFEAIFFNESFSPRRRLYEPEASSNRGWLYTLSQSSEILLELSPNILLARHLTETQGKIRKRVLLTTKCRFFSLVGLSQPTKESRDLTDHAAEPLRAVGFTLRPVSPTGWKRSRRPSPSRPRLGYL